MLHKETTAKLNKLLGTHMSTDYNQIAEQYKESKLSPWRTFIEQFTLLDLIGDLGGKSVLDLACGEGYYSRLLKRAGAERVLGLDLSEKMIELGRDAESQSPLDVEYLAADAIGFVPEEKFDLVVAAYLLNYAQNEETLVGMSETIARSLKPGGRFITVNNNPSQSPETFRATEKYGFIKSADEDLKPGTPITYTIFQASGSFQFDNYYLSREAHERALRAAGLDEIEWIDARLSPDWDGETGYWDDFFADPSIVFLQCRSAMSTEA